MGMEIGSVVGKRDTWCWRFVILRERGLVGVGRLRWLLPVGDGFSFFSYGIKSRRAGIVGGNESGGKFILDFTFPICQV